MEEAAAEEGDRQMGITPTFEEWKANKRVMWVERKTQSSISPVGSVSASCDRPSDGGAEHRKVEHSLHICSSFHTCGINRISFPENKIDQIFL